MLLELFIWGAWFPVVADYMKHGLGFDEAQRGWVFNAFAAASITAMLFSTPFVDRRFAAEKFLAVSHLIGGLAMIGLAFIRDFWPFFGLMLVHSLFYVPTLSIANSLAFSHLGDAKREFGVVRMGGTVGWILAAWPLFFILRGRQGADAVPLTASVFLVAGVASLVLAAYCRTLPHTPPVGATRSGFAWVDAAKLLRLPFLLVLFVVTFVDAAVHQGYFLFTYQFLGEVGIGEEWRMPVMSLGQVAEIATMAVLGSVLRALGWRWTMTLGVLGHAVRFSVFALLPDRPELVVAVNLLHGVCYAFFFATVYIFVDEYFPKHTRATAQGLFNFLILGAGPFAGNVVWHAVQAEYTVDGDTDFTRLFTVLAGTALAAAVVLAVAFWPPRLPPQEAG